MTPEPAPTLTDRPCPVRHAVDPVTAGSWRASRTAAPAVGDDPADAPSSGEGLVVKLKHVGLRAASLATEPAALPRSSGQYDERVRPRWCRRGQVRRLRDEGDAARRGLNRARLGLEQSPEIAGPYERPWPGRRCRAEAIRVRPVAPRRADVRVPEVRSTTNTSVRPLRSPATMFEASTRTPPCGRPPSWEMTPWREGPLGKPPSEARERSWVS